MSGAAIIGTAVAIAVVVVAYLGGTPIGDAAFYAPVAWTIAYVTVHGYEDRQNRKRLLADLRRAKGAPGREAVGEKRVVDGLDGTSYGR